MVVFIKAVRDKFPETENFFYPGRGQIAGSGGSDLSEIMSGRKHRKFTAGLRENPNILRLKY
jgi:hypothetical protein